MFALLIAFTFRPTFASRPTGAFASVLTFGRKLGLLNLRWFLIWKLHVGKKLFDVDNLRAYGSVFFIVSLRYFLI